jgi:hypothetical protein
MLPLCYSLLKHTRAIQMTDQLTAVRVGHREGSLTCSRYMVIICKDNTQETFRTSCINAIGRY